MSRLRNPNVLVTRPDPSASEFVAALRKVSGPFRPLISPAFEYEPIPAAVPDFDAAIFTSKAGVAFAPDGKQRPAWCVGRATAQAANNAGYTAVSADGSADDLVAMILRKRPTDALLHIRGEITRGNVTDRLRAAGVNCKEVVVYRKAPCAPSGPAIAALRGRDPVIIPVFSAETVTIVQKWGLLAGRITFVAISTEVADEIDVTGDTRIVTASRPDLSSMTQAVASLIA